MTMILDKVSIRTTDYVAAVNQAEEIVECLMTSAKGVVCSGKYKKGLRFVENPSDLDESAFDKIITNHGVRSLDCYIKACSNLGLVLVQNIPVEQRKNYLKYLDQNGIYEWWDFQDSKNSFDLLFKVKKYSHFDMELVSNWEDPEVRLKH